MASVFYNPLEWEDGHYCMPATDDETEALNSKIHFLYLLIDITMTVHGHFLCVRHWVRYQELKNEQYLIVKNTDIMEMIFSMINSFTRGKQKVL